jgi:hypothetical protein
MARLSLIEPEFVELIPPELSFGRLYVSMKYATTQHLCACGCGKKVVLPLSPAEWSLRYDGETVSMSPSVGNREYTCRSHYWIERNRIHWAKAWSPEQIEVGRARDLADLETYFEVRREAGAPVVPEPASPWWRRLIRRFGRHPR